MISPLAAANTASKRRVLVPENVRFAQAALTTAPIPSAATRGSAQQAAHAPMSATDAQRLFFDEKVGPRIPGMLIN